MENIHSADWLGNITEWVDTSLAANGRSRKGELELIHQRTWSTVWRVPTDKNNAYLKAVTAYARHEPAVTALIATSQPNAFPQLYGVDAEQGWLLMADGGQRLREAFKNGRPMNQWQDALVEYANLQIHLADHTDKLLAIKTPDLRLTRLPEAFEDLVTGMSWLAIDLVNGISTEEHDQLLFAIRTVAHLCRELATHPIPLSLNHHDLHDGNIFTAESGFYFFDWGDSVLTHPFFSLRTVFVSMENTFGLDEADPIFDAYARAYLGPWARFENEDKLWEAYTIARRLWSISSAVKYKTLMQVHPEIRPDYAATIPGLLQEFLAANPDVFVHDL